MIRLVGYEEGQGGFKGIMLPVFKVGEQHLLEMDLPKGKWSGKKHPPKVGDKVRVIFNQFRSGVVLDHVVRDGWLGVIVQIDRIPDWSLKQNGRQREFTFFGAELEY